jgi:hypothetical protein
MFRRDKITLEAVADLLINISAAWFAAVFIAPPFFDFSSPSAALLLAGNIVTGIVSLVSSIKLRRLAQREIYD